MTRDGNQLAPTSSFSAGKVDSIVSANCENLITRQLNICLEIF